MALPFLPEEEIEPMFQRLQRHASEPLRQFTEYNRRASGRGQLPMYLLIKFLHKEATLTALQIRLVSEKKLKRIQRRKYRELQAKLFELWDQYEACKKDINKRLKTFHMWNELTFLWNELTILWNNLTIDWNDLTWNDLTMERNDRKSMRYVQNL